jgi:hypothetical protein
MTMTTTTMVAMGGATPKDYGTGNLSPAVAMVMALQNVLPAPPRPIGVRYHLQGEGCSLEAVILRQC